MRIPFKLALITSAVLLTACSTAPTNTTLLDQTRSEYQVARNSDSVNRYAASELTQSAEALDQANAASTAHENAEKVDRLAYLAKQKIAVAEDVAKQKSAEAVVADAEKQRNALRLASRTAQADKAIANADMANQIAAVSQINEQAAQATAQAEQARADRLEQQLKDLNAKKTEHGIIITFGDILFNTNEARLNPSGVGVAQKLAMILNENPQRTVQIGGFTDSTGSADYNMALSVRRATAVSDILSGAGVTAQRIGVKGYGMSNPIADNSTAQNRQLNRRVEITLSDAGGNIVGAR